MNDVDKIAGGGAVFLAQLPDPWLSEECLRRCMALTERFPIVKKHVIGASLTGLALALTPFAGAASAHATLPDYFGIDAPDHVDVNKPLNFRLDKCDMDGASQIKWGVAKGESAPPETWTTVKDEQQRVSYTPTSTGTYTIWAYCANVSGERVSDSGSSSFTSYSTKATMNPTKWAADEYVRMVTKGFNSSDTLSASLVRDGDTKDYGDLLDSQRIWYQWASETSDFTFPGNVPVGDYTLTFTDHGNTARTVRVHLDHGAGYLLSGDTPKPTPTPLPRRLRLLPRSRLLPRPRPRLPVRLLSSRFRVLLLRRRPLALLMEVIRVLCVSLVG